MPEAAAAASPAPSASAEDFGAYPSLEVWLDKALQPDAPAGSTIEIGFTIWDSHGASSP